VKYWVEKIIGAAVVGRVVGDHFGRVLVNLISNFSLRKRQ
jgi:hypothetical protein